MSNRYPGGFITLDEPTVNSSSAKGVWTLDQQADYQGQGVWPTSTYQISRSLRFNSADSAYLNRTPASAGNRKTWTWSGWVKRSAISSASIQSIFGCYLSGGSSYHILNFATNDRFIIYDSNVVTLLETNAVYRDVSSWYHIVFAYDTTQATSSNRAKLYINGVQVTSFATATYPSQNADGIINSTTQHNIGSSQPFDGRYFNGYMAEVHFVDGQALTPSDFGETDAVTGVWTPIAYAGTYGTNGFYLDFSDNSGTTSTTLGADSSGNGNNWTPNNFSVTAGAGNDSLVDTPTPYGTDTGAGGEVRGNYATWNPLFLSSGYTLTEGNLRVNGALVNQIATISTFSMTSGKWYWEITITALGPSECDVGIANNNVKTSDATLGSVDNGFSWRDNGSFRAGSGTAYVSAVTYTTGDVLNFAFDADTRNFWFGKNGTWLGSGNPATDTNPTGLMNASSNFFVGIRPYNTGAISDANFGQRPFAYTAPSGFKALCTTNLPEPTVLQGDDYFNTVLYTGTGSTQSITSVGFQPDLVWFKNRGAANAHALFDSVRGRAYGLSSNTTGAEFTSAAGRDLASFDSTGFTVGQPENWNSTNISSGSLVAWNWNAGGSNATNTDGTITSTVRANPTAGFSVVTYTGNNVAGSTVGHGLGVIPSIVICKARSTSGNPWIVWHNKLSGPSYYLILNDTPGQATNINMFNNTLPTSSVFSLGGNVFSQNESGQTFVAYVFAEVPGFSAFGSYTGNGSTDGPFVYTGFRPAFLILKRSSSANNWVIQDSKRLGYNPNSALYANLTTAEQVKDFSDLTSNGFKIRSTETAVNGSGSTYIYIAFAENPFKNSLAR